MKYFFILLITLINSAAFAQKGKIEGKVTDEKTGAALAGVSVSTKSGQKGTFTNIEGRYTLNVDAGKITLEFSYNGASKIVSDVEVIEGKITIQDVALEQKVKTTDEVVVVSRTSARKETAASLISFQKSTNTVASVISAESIRRSPDRNTGDVLKRTAGASLQDGRFLVVRGLADRYNQAMLNGVLLTSTEPDRKTFSFDLLPAQIIDNIIVNKAFVPELPGEWAGGLVQVNTKDIPSKNFLNVQLGTSVNTLSTGKTFYKDAVGGKLDWLGIDDGTRALPSNYTTKSSFDILPIAQKIEVGKNMRNSWVPNQSTASPNYSVQLNGGFKGKVFGKTVGGIAGVSYNRNYRHQLLLNRRSIPDYTSGAFGTQSNYDDNRYNQETVVGAMASASLQFNSLNKIALKSIINVNNGNIVINRTGYDITRGLDQHTKANEFTFKQTTFFTAQLTGEHLLMKPLKLQWYGAFNILDAYSPDQRRIWYEKYGTGDYQAVLATLSQQSGSHIYQNLSDYIYTAGGDLAYTYTAWKRKQALKVGYMFQVKDRLFDAQLFGTFLAGNNPQLLSLSPDKLFVRSNYGNGFDNLLSFNSISNRNFRYLANTILNAGFIQSDNQISDKIRTVWGLRFEHYDQLIGSVKKWDPRHTYSKTLDILPGANITYKLNSKTNLRFSVSQTVVRPELRELSKTILYDFELNASVQGSPELKRAKVFNTDIRYEYYPRAGELFTAGLFYKKFKTPIEQMLQEGGGGSSLFFFENPEKATTYGIELEARKKLDAISALKNFTIQANVSLIKSNVKDTALAINRPLQGQSPYLINAGLMYDLEKYGINATMLFNMIGRRIYLVGDLSAAAASPDVWEAPRPQLDFQIAKKIIHSKGELKLSVSDIMNKRFLFYQNIDPNKNLRYDEWKDAVRFTRKQGTTFSLSFNYNF